MPSQVYFTRKELEARFHVSRASLYRWMSQQLCKR